MTHVVAPERSGGAGAPTRPAIALLSRVLGFVVLGAMSVAFALSFAAIVYGGAGPQALALGIAHTLLGAGIMALAGAALFSFRETICVPQDITSLLLASAVPGMLAGAALGPGATAATVGTLVMVSAFGAALATGLAGYFRLGAVARLLPHPVIAGLLAATGLLLVLGAIGLVLGRSVSVWDLPALVTGEVLWRWSPWVGAGVLLAWAVHRSGRVLMLPLALAVLLAGFYLMLALLDLDLETAAAAGMLIGPFEGESLGAMLQPGMVLRADWGLIGGQSVTIAAVMALAVVGAMLNAAGLEKVMGRDFDLERELRATSLGNFGAALVGGQPGYATIGESLFGIRMGLSGWQAPLAMALPCLGALVFGAEIVGGLPLGFFATVVAYLGTDLLITWLWEERQRLGKTDYALILGIVAVAAAVGVLEALGVGLAASVVLFLVAYARVDVVHLRSSLAQRRSRVERAPAEVDWLAEHGEGTRILELQGFLFFGTAETVRRVLREEIAHAPLPDRLILDLSRVTGIDASAVHALERTLEEVARRHVAVVVTGLGRALERDAPFSAEGVHVLRTLDAALEQAEEKLLARAGKGSDAGRAQAIGALSALARRSGPVERLELAAGALLSRQGETSSALYLLVRGEISAEVTTARGARVRVAKFVPGAVIGELAHYAGVARTADLVAEAPSEVLRIDLQRLEREAPVEAGAVHRQIARILARRLVSTTALMRHAGF